MMLGMTDKADSLAQKMNKLTEKFDLAEEIEVQGDDIIEFIDEKTDKIELYEEKIAPTSIINLEIMTEDFKFIRETLKESIKNGRRVLNSVTIDLLESDDDKRAQLIMSFAELNKSISDNTKQYTAAYKDISTVLLNMDKIMAQQEPEGPKTVNNNNTLVVAEAVSTAELIKRMKG
jgi:Cu/Ag efflux protein CusF